MTVVWGFVGMLVGVVIAAQLLFPALNFDLPWLTYSRLRPEAPTTVQLASCDSLAAVERTAHALGISLSSLAVVLNAQRLLRNTREAR
jgi:cytochrome c oxidase cbb3-type subunit 1